MKLIFTLVLLILSSISYAQGEQGESLDSKYWDDVEIHLITLGRNEVVYTGGGHSLLRVIDRSRGRDMVFNWGVFDFRDPAFAFKFYKGTLLYAMQGSRTAEDFQFLKRHMRREYLEDKVNLTNDQKRLVLERVGYWLRPENNRYRYHFFKNNCSTQVRDVLDYALHGSIKAHFESQIGSWTPRGLWQLSYGYWPELLMLTDFVFNSRVDYSLSKWEEMFNPALMRKHLLNMKLSAVDHKGEVGDSVTLLSGSKSLIEYTPPSPSIFNGHQWFALVFGSLTIFSVLLGHYKSRKAGLCVMGGLAILWGLIAGVYGVMIPVTSAISSLQYFHWSINLLYLWPLDLLLVVVGFKWIRCHDLPRSSALYSKWIPWILKAHVIGVVLFVGDYMLGVSGTNSFRNAVYVIPILLMFWHFLHKNLVDKSRSPG